MFGPDKCGNDHKVSMMWTVAFNFQFTVAINKPFWQEMVYIIYVLRVCTLSYVSHVALFHIWWDPYWWQYYKYIADYSDKQGSLALASTATDDPPASSTASSTAAAMRGKVGSEFETEISFNPPMHFRHRQMDTGIIA